MSDYQFPIRPADLLESNVHQATRKAVLWPLVGRPNRDKEETPVHSLLKLQRRWRHRLLMIQEAGWKPLAKPETPATDNQDEKGAYEAAHHTAQRNLQYMRNCPPFSVRPGEVVARRCKRTRLCPMCYARDIVGYAYHSANWLLHHTTIGKRFKEGLRVIAVRQELEHSLELMVKQKSITSAAKGMLTDYNTMKDHALGAFLNVTMEPVAKTGRVLFRRSTLAVVPADGPQFTFNAGTRQETGVTSRQLANLVGWCFPYPIGMMYGEPSAAVQLLDALARPAEKGKMPPRLTHAVGLFDNKQWRSAYDHLVATARKIEDGREESGTAAS